MIKSMRLFFSLTLIMVLAFGDLAYAASLQGSPTSNNRETSPFGYRASTNSNHLALDYGATNAGVAGDPTFSTISGTVVESRYQTNSTQTGGWGNTVLVESDSGNYRVRYSHLDQPGLSTGTRVNPGDTIGAMGGSGKAGGYAVHLDYAVYVKNPDTGKFQAIDPNQAAGLNLDDPDVARALITDAESKIAGDLREEGDALGDAGHTVDNSGGSDAAPIGCDPSILAGGTALQNAYTQKDIEIGKAIFTPLPDIGQMTCVDQHIALNNQAGGISSNPGGDISSSMAPLVEAPAVQWVTSNFMDSPLAGSVGSMINDTYSDVVAEFDGVMSDLSGAADSLTGLTGMFGGGSAAYECDMMEQSWLLSQCIQLPNFPSITDVLNGVLGAAADLLNSPFEALGAACQAVSSQLGAFANDSGGVFRDAANSLTDPITDTFQRATDTIVTTPADLINGN